MTLKARNRILILFFVIALVDAAVNVGIFVHSLMEGSLSFPPGAERQMQFLASQDLLAYEPLAVCLSALAFNIFVPIATIFLYISFEKTQALETIYFLGFLLGCMAEGTRIFTPVYSLAQNSPSSLVTGTRIVIGARTLAPLSFLFAELFNDTESRQFVERNLGIMLLVSIFMGLLMPLDTGRCSSIFTYRWGLQEIFHLCRLLVVVTTLAAIACKIAASYSVEMVHEGVGFLLGICGYFVLCNSDNFVLMGGGIALLFFGSFYYLSSMHQIYRWR